MSSQVTTRLKKINTPINGTGIPHKAKGEKLRYTALNGRTVYVKNPSQKTPLAAALRDLAFELNSNRAHAKPWDKEQLSILKTNVEKHVRGYDNAYCKISQFFNYLFYGSVNKYANEIYSWIDSHGGNEKSLPELENVLKSGLPNYGKVETRKEMLAEISAIKNPKLILEIVKTLNGNKDWSNANRDVVDAIWAAVVNLKLSSVQAREFSDAAKEIKSQEERQAIVEASVRAEKAIEEDAARKEAEKAKLERERTQRLESEELMLSKMLTVNVVHRYVSESSSEFDEIYHKIIIERARAGLMSHLDALKVARKKVTETIKFNPTGDWQKVYELPLIVALSAMHRLRLQLPKDKNEFPNQLMTEWVPAWERIMQFVSTGVLKEENVPREEVIKLLKAAVHLEVHNLPFSLTELLLNNIGAKTFNLDVDISRSIVATDGPFASNLQFAHVIPAYVTPAILNSKDNKWVPNVDIRGVYQMARPLLWGEFKEIEKRFTLHFDKDWLPTEESIKKLQLLVDVFSIQAISINNLLNRKAILQQILQAFPNVKFSDPNSVASYFNRNYKVQDPEFYKAFAQEFNKRHPKPAA